MKNKTITTLFTIDLLNGEALPAKTKSAVVVLAVITAAIPVFLLTVLFGLHGNNRVVTSIMKNDIVVLDAKIDKLSDDVKRQKSLENQKRLFLACLSEVQTSTKKFTQWSPVLADLAESMPHSVVLKELEIKHESVKKKVPKKDDPKKFEEKDIPFTTMRLIVSNVLEPDSIKAIQDFQDQLYASPVIGPRLDKIIVSTSDSSEEKSVVEYEIDCVFKAEI